MMWKLLIEFIVLLITTLYVVESVIAALYLKKKKEALVWVISWAALNVFITWLLFVWFA